MLNTSKNPSDENSHHHNEVDILMVDIPDQCYIDIEEYSEELIEHPHLYKFNAQQFSKYFTEHLDYNYNLKLMRRFVQSQTNLSFQRGFYYSNSSNNTISGQETIIKIDRNEIIKSAKNVQYYSDSTSMKVISSLPKKTNKKTKIRVQEGDCLECAINELSKNGKVGVLNMSSAKRPGGGYREGAGAQEENLFRRTSLAFTLEDVEFHDTEREWSYPIIDKVGGVHVPNVKIIRGSEQDGYPFLNQIYNVDVICVPAFRTPKLDHTGNRIESREIIDWIRKRMKLMLAMAYHHNITTLVLSAWGCGAYRNPPSHIAQLFKQTLIEHDGLFDEIIFAIFNDKNAERNGKDNVKPFKDQFDP